MLQWPYAVASAARSHARASNRTFNSCSSLGRGIALGIEYIFSPNGRKLMRRSLGLMRNFAHPVEFEGYG